VATQDSINYNLSLIILGKWSAWISLKGFQFCTSIIDNCIMVVVDKFSKYAHFVPLTQPFTALKVAVAYMDNIYKLHGFPQAIISDRDRIFTSALWKELFRLAGTTL